MNFPIIEQITKNAKDLVRWFFVTILFSTKELQADVHNFFECGKTSFRYFEWLNLSRMRQTYPERWKYICADFAGAYFKLALLGVTIVLGYRFIFINFL